MSEAQKPTTNAYRENWQSIWGKRERRPRCKECFQDYADGPSGLCPGCEAYREHQQ